MTHILRKIKLLLIFPLCALFFLIGVVTVHATTYYVATTGSDENPGTSELPWRNPQKCTTSPILAGDTCIAKDGTYTDSDANGIVVYASGTSVSGGVSQPITIKSENPNGAKIVVSSAVNAVNSGFYITRPYYIIEGFEITGGANPGLSASHTGIFFTSTATGGIARLNTIHHIGRALCSESLFSESGIYIDSVSGVLIEQNLLYSIGRLRNGESGCSTTIYQHDHGIYASATTNLTILRNVIYDTNRGYPIHIYKSGGTTTNLKIYNNTMAGKSPTGLPAGHIILSNTVNTANIKNNISHDAAIGMVNLYKLSAFNVTVSFNLSDTIENTSVGLLGVTFSNNLQHTSPGFVNAAKNNFHLSAGSAAIDAGTNVGILTQDGAPDIGAHEVSNQGDTSAPHTPFGLRLQ